MKSRAAAGDICSNHADALFSHMRRTEIDAYHGSAPLPGHLRQGARLARGGNGQQFWSLRWLAGQWRYPRSPQHNGYWQRHIVRAIVTMS